MSIPAVKASLSMQVAQEADLVKYSQEVARLFAGGDPEGAAALCECLVRDYSQSAAIHLLASQVFQQLGRFERTLDCANRAVALDPRDEAARLRAIEGMIFCGQIGLARERLATLETEAANNHRLLQHLAERYIHCQDHTGARRCHSRAAELEPHNPHYQFNHATSLVAHGDIDGAEAAFNEVIRLNPDDFGAHQNRTMLRTWKADNHHVDELTKLLARLPDGHPGEVPLCFALAKEYEDLEDYANAFALLRRGASARRAKLAYRVEADVEAMQHIARVFNRAALEKVRNTDQPGPLFVLGLPRSGTTLVDRILSSHSQVKSLGEINDFAFALIGLCGSNGKGGKQELVEKSAQLDFAALGERYSRAIAGYGYTAPHLINKTPQNYLYLGLLRQALPAARIVHLRRHPLDSCFAMYKTLFRMGYPFSYSLEDLGHYYIAYHRLMQHWRECLPGGFFDMDYETLVDRQEESSRELLRYCGLEWEDACLDFHKNTAPAATASAAQVRKSIYRTSVGRWQVYRRELEPLVELLTNADIDCAS